MASNLSYASTPLGFRYHYQTVPERMAFHAQRRGDKEVYVFLHPDGRRDTVTAAKLYDQSMKLARSFVNLGIRKGDVVAASLVNDLDALVCILGIICAGGIVLNVTINTEDGSDLSYLLTKTKAKCLILTPGSKRLELKACLNVIDEVHQDGHVTSKTVPTLKYLISTDKIEDIDVLLLGDLYKQENSCELPRLDPEDYFILFTTSGSTGEPKLVPQSHHSATIVGLHLQKSFGYDADVDIIYSERRFSWIGGFPYIYLHDGVKVVNKTMPFNSLSEHCKFTYIS